MALVYQTLTSYFFGSIFTSGQDLVGLLRSKNNEKWILYDNLNLYLLKTVLGRHFSFLIVEKHPVENQSSLDETVYLSVKSNLGKAVPILKLLSATFLLI